jgi:hypothetical protein
MYELLLASLVHLLSSLKSHDSEYFDQRCDDMDEINRNVLNSEPMLPIRPITLDLNGQLIVPPQAPVVLFLD